MILEFYENIIEQIQHEKDRNIGGNDPNWICGYKCGLGEAIEIIKNFYLELLKCDKEYREYEYLSQKEINTMLTALLDVENKIKGASEI